MKNKKNLIKVLTKILKEIRFGNLTNRLNKDEFENDEDFVNDFNNMLDALEDREKMLSENQIISLDKNEQLTAMFNMMNDGIMTLTDDLKLISINTTQINWFKKSKKKLLNKSLIEILDEYNIYDKNLNEVNTKYSYPEFFSSDKKNCIFTFEIRKSKRTFSISVKSFLNKNKKTNYLIVSKDITPDIELEKLKNTFYATLTHDLKVPIIAEQKVLELLLAGNCNKSMRLEALQNMLTNNKDMMNLVTTLLDVYKLEDGIFSINKTHIDVLSIIENEIDKLKFLCAESGVVIVIKNEIQDTRINADKNELARVVRNILTNALNFAPAKSKIIIRIFLENKYLNIAITDKGVGIPAENLPYIFDRYFTSDKKYRKVGTGLGLYLSKKIIQLHNGTINVESIPNKKTTFTISLPLD